MNKLALVALVLLSSCKFGNSKVDPDLNRYFDHEYGVACYTVDKSQGVFCIKVTESNKEAVNGNSN
jgi:hypothetical protein